MEPARQRPRLDAPPAEIERAVGQAAICLSQGRARQALEFLRPVAQHPAVAESEPFQGCWGRAHHEVAQTLIDAQRLGATIGLPGSSAAGYEAPFHCERLACHLGTLAGSARSLEILACQERRPQWLARYGDETLATYEGLLRNFVQLALTDAELVFAKIAELNEVRSSVAVRRSALSFGRQQNSGHWSNVLREMEQDPWFADIAAATQEQHEEAIRAEPRMYWTFWLGNQQEQWARRPEVAAGRAALRAARPG